MEYYLTQSNKRNQLSNCPECKSLLVIPGKNVIAYECIEGKHIVTKIEDATNESTS